MASQIISIMKKNAVIATDNAKSYLEGDMQKPNSITNIAARIRLEIMTDHPHRD